MKKMLSALAILAFATSAQAVVFTTPPTRQLMPIAQPTPAAPVLAPGQIEAPAIQSLPNQVQQQPLQPVYYQNGRPVYSNAPPNNQTANKVQSNNCQDKGGNYIPCPAPAAPGSQPVNTLPANASGSVTGSSNVVYPATMGNDSGAR